MEAEEPTTDAAVAEAAGAAGEEEAEEEVSGCDRWLAILADIARGMEWPASACAAGGGLLDPQPNSGCAF